MDQIADHEEVPENRVIHCSHPTQFCPPRQQLTEFNALGFKQLT